MSFRSSQLGTRRTQSSRSLAHDPISSDPKFLNTESSSSRCHHHSEMIYWTAGPLLVESSRGEMIIMGLELMDRDSFRPRIKGKEFHFRFRISAESTGIFSSFDFLLKKNANYRHHASLHRFHLSSLAQKPISLGINDSIKRWFEAR